MRTFHFRIIIFIYACIACATVGLSQNYETAALDTFLSKNKELLQYNKLYLEKTISNNLSIEGFNTSLRSYSLNGLMPKVERLNQLQNEYFIDTLNYPLSQITFEDFVQLDAPKSMLIKLDHHFKYKNKIYVFITVKRYEYSIHQWITAVIFENKNIVELKEALISN